MKLFFCVLSLLLSFHIALFAQHPSAREQGNIGQVNFDVNTVTLLKSTYPSLQGKGFVIGQKEQSPDLTDIDFFGRILANPNRSGEVTTHATMVASIMLGSGFSSPKSEGVAPLANLINFNFKSLFPESDDFLTQYKIKVVNHSYGSEIENFYGQQAVAYDNQANRLPNVLHIFSSGNVGYATPNAGLYKVAGYANLTGNFKMAKNILTVGAIDGQGTITNVSSRGPAFDGRIKPEVVAYSEEGTSGAAALVSGITALMQEQYLQTMGTNAPAALLKALLINSADDIGTEGIDFQTGFGSVNAVKAVESIVKKQFFSDVIGANQGKRFSLVLPKMAKNLKITLVWSDPAAAINTSKALVNNLDITLTLGNKKWLPWVLNSYPQADSLQQLPKQKVDTLNNIEQISLTDAEAGTYTIDVSARKLSTENQPFYIAYQWEEPSFVWIAPNKKSTLTTGNLYTLRWKNTSVEKLGEIQFSSNQGKTWGRVANNIQLASGLWTWESPDIPLLEGRFRMLVGKNAFESQDVIINPVLSVKIPFACEDSIGLDWSDLSYSAVPKYAVLKLDPAQGTWTNVLTTSRTSATIKPIKSSDYLAVVPINSSNTWGMRSTLQTTRPEDIYCFYQNFYAGIANEYLANIQVTIPFPEMVKQVTFQKITPSGIQNLITNLVQKDQTEYGTLDESLLFGGNVYRLKIDLVNGITIYSDSKTVFNLTEKTPVWVYPNPVKQGDILHFNANDYGNYQLLIFDVLGKRLYEGSFFNTAFTIPTKDFQAGLYLYKINKDDVPFQSGQVLIGF